MSDTVSRGRYAVLFEEVADALAQAAERHRPLVEAAREIVEQEPHSWGGTKSWLHAMRRLADVLAELEEDGGG